ncbi:MAG: hypothetical protein VX527_09130, partial [Planctomycetota bacterium]|nr:hypothetical protein [Planctomycetota bacterium]
WTRLLTTFAMTLSLACTGCDKGTDEANSGNSETAAEKAQEAKSLGKSLGSMTIEGSTLEVRGKGDFHAGAEIELNIVLTGGSEPSHIHAWVGPRSGEGVEKVRAHADGDHYHVNVKVPGTVTDRTMLWIEVESSDGKSDSRSIRMR